MSDWQPIEMAPKDGREVYLEMPAKMVKAYWDEDLKTWVLSRQYHLDTIRNPERWQPAPRPEPSDPLAGLRQF